MRLDPVQAFSVSPKITRIWCRIYVGIRFLSPLKCFFQLSMLLYSSRAPVWTSLYVPLFLLFSSTFFKCLCPLLWNPGGTDRTEPLFYIAGCIFLIILVTVRSMNNPYCWLLSLLHRNDRTLLHFTPSDLLKQRLFHPAQSI